MNRCHLLVASACAVFASAALQAQAPEEVKTSPLAPDSEFVQVATGNELATVKMSDIALQKASTVVKDFAKRMADDHRRVGDDLASVANQEGLPVATMMNAKNKAIYDVLSGLPDVQLGETYIRFMIRALSGDIVVFQKEADTGKNTKLSNFASAKLPLLKEHLKLARDAASKLGLTVETIEP